MGNEQELIPEPSQKPATLLLQRPPECPPGPNWSEHGPSAVPSRSPRRSQSRVTEQAKAAACAEPGEGEPGARSPAGRCPRVGGFIPRSRTGRGGGVRGRGEPLHLAGLVMMRVEKSKRSLLILRRLLTSSSSSLTWIVRCSWSPTRFCDTKMQQTSVRASAVTGTGCCSFSSSKPQTLQSPSPSSSKCSPSCPCHQQISGLFSPFPTCSGSLSQVS